MKTNSEANYGEYLVKEVLKYIGENPEREGLKETPGRIVRMWKEIFRGYDPNQKPKITTFNNDMECEDIVFDTGMYYSVCEHHMMPFFGNYYFAYIPKKDGKILGISKVSRVVQYCSAKLQVQERLAREIVKMLMDALDNYVEGAAMVMKGTHLCKSMRGAKSNGEMTTAYLTGKFKDNPDCRAEFYKIIDAQKKW